MKENPLESRRVRTQPCTVTFSRGSVAAKMCLISVRMTRNQDLIMAKAIRVAR
jgi:hypothetical protein